MEADPTTCERLRRNIAANAELAPAIEVSESRIGLEPNPDDGTVTLDELAFRPGGFVPDLVKMDIEGHEARHSAVRSGSSRSGSRT